MTRDNIAKNWSKQTRKEFLDHLVGNKKLSGELKEYLIDEGILECPASAKYHGAYPGALFEHCVALYEFLVGMTLHLGVEWTRPESPGNIAFGHDACKLDSYIARPLWDIETTENEEKVTYEYNKDSVFHGHAMKSVILCQQACRLTEEEVYCILYHMGAYEKEQWEAFDKAIKRYPNVLYVHTADMYASKIVGV